MEKIVKTFLLLLVFGTMAVSVIQAQKNIPAELERRLMGKTKVVEIMKEVNEYYDFGKANINPPDGDSDWEGDEYHMWKRWEYWAMRRLNPDGTLANHRSRNFLAQQQVEAKFGPQMKEAEQNLKQNNGWANEQSPGLNSPHTSYGNWSPAGPFGGGTVVGSGTNIDINGVARMDRIAFHPTDANTMYTGSPSGSIYKTTNGGTNWDDIGWGLPLGVACIEVAPSNGNVIYVFSGDGDSHVNNFFVFVYDVSPISQGLYKSTDGGNTWTKCTDMYTGVNDLVGHQIAVSHNNSNYLFVATNQGLYRTTDGGDTWEQVRTGEYYDVEFRPFNDSTVYTSTPTTIERSINGGRSGTWTASTITPAPAIVPTRIDLAVRRNTSGVQSTFVYAIFSAAAAGSFSGIYKSEDVGVTFNRQSNTPNILGSTKDGSDGSSQSRYNLGICVKPTDPNYIVTAGLNVWRSDGSNGGTSMVYSTIFREGFGLASEYIHPDVHDVQYNPLDGVLYACSDGGVYKSVDDGVAWTNLSTGLYGTQFYHMKMKDADGDGDMDGLETIAGAQDNGVKYRTSGGAWRHILCCDGYDAVIKGSDGGWVLMTFNGGKYRTPDGGVTMVPEGSSSSFSPVAIDWDNDDTMYVASNNQLQRSFDGGQTFTNITVDRDNIIVTCPSNSARLYGGSSAKTDLSRSDDRGSNWTTISGNPGWPAGNPIVTDCKPWPSLSSEIYASFGGYNDGVKVYRSLDAGANWTDISGSLPNVPVHSLSVATEGVYAGTEIGVFFRPDGASDWTPFYTGMPRALVTDIWVNQNGLVYAGTFGHGVWYANRYSACFTDINVSGTLDGPHYYEASSTANVTANSQSGEGTEIYVKSNGYVDLLNGFEMRDGTFFEAWIGPCGGGIPDPSRVESNSEIRVPRISEIEAKAKQPVSTGNYFDIINGKVEFNLTETGKLKMKARQENGEWLPFYPEYKTLPGFYSLPLPNGKITEIQIMVDGKKLNQLKPPKATIKN